MIKKFLSWVRRDKEIRELRQDLVKLTMMQIKFIEGVDSALRARDSREEKLMDAILELQEREIYAN